MKTDAVRPENNLIRLKIKNRNEQETACIAPATGEVIAGSFINSMDDVQKAVDLARAAQAQWASLPVKKRAALIKPLCRYIVDHADELAGVISRDNGKTRIDAMTTELLPAAMAVDYYCRKAGKFFKDRRLMPGNVMLANKLSKIVRVPYGVIGIISPWNYPFAIPFSEVIMALLAGNAVILKAASETQLVGRAIDRCIASLEIPHGVFGYINMPGRLTGEAFLKAGVDKLFFTGSVAVGKKLMALAADSLTPLVLELGGNDPMLVCPDADLERAATGAVWAGLQNCGQSCSGVERIYVHRSIYTPFMELLTQKVTRLRVGVDIDHNVDLGAITTARQMREVQRQIDDAVKAGAVICASSQAPEGAGGNFMPAVVLTHVDHSMDIMRLETFGPVLAVMAVDDMDEAVALANDSDFGLTASIWTKNNRQGQRLARRIRAGVVMINDHLMSHGMAETPWGGFKHSSIGRTHGEIGMAEMTQPQCIVSDHLPFVRRNLWWHPYSPAVYLGVRGILHALYGKGIRCRLSGLARLIGVVPRMFRAKERV